jgi:hypothetical protein
VHARPPRVSKRTAVCTLVGLCVASGAVVAALLVAPASNAVPTQPWSVAGPLVVADLPVARCPTSYGIPPSRRVHLPARVSAQVTAALAPTLSVFTDGLGTLDVVAPRAWGCTALDGVAGSSKLVVYPPGDPRPSWGDVTAVRRGIVASQTGGCDGCSLETACPLFVSAARQYRAIYRTQCRSGAAGTAELRTRLTGSTVLFVDPPGVPGTGQPSGSGFAAYGAMLWHLVGARQPAAWLDTCTLPAPDHDLCVLSVRAFLSRHPGATGDRAALFGS